MSTQDKTVIDLRKFLEQLPSLDLVGDNTLKNLKTVPRMLECIRDKTTEFEMINVEETVEDYIVATKAQVGPASKSSYRSRINQAIKLYASYLNDPESLQEIKEKTVTNVAQIKQERAVNTPRTIDIPVPIREGMILTIPGVPTDLTNEEAERIASILKVYARPQ